MEGAAGKETKQEEEARIRPASVADGARLIQVVNDAFAVESFIDGTRTDEDRLAEMMRRGKFFVAENHAGLVVASVYTELRGDRGYFGMLAVDPSQQGKGFASKMIRFVEDYCRARGCRWMDITVLTLRPELPPFYSRFGYAETRREDFHPSAPLKPGVECRSIIMSKRL